MAIEQIYPEETTLFRVEVLQKIPNALARRGPSLIEALIADQASPWINPPEGSMAWRLTEIDQRLKVGDSHRAAELLAAAEPFLSCAEKAEVPEYWHLHGRMLSLSGDESASLEPSWKSRA